MPTAESRDSAAPTAAVALLPTAFSPPDFKPDLPVQQATSKTEESSAANPGPSGSRAKSSGTGDGERVHYKVSWEGLVSSFQIRFVTFSCFNQEHRRVCHINAEQKRRCNIKNGFDTLQSLLPGSGSGGSGGGGSGLSPSAGAAAAAHHPGATEGRAT